ncbi:MAG: ATP-binding cassette domain-containing protein [Pirellulales bacterium]
MALVTIRDLSLRYQGPSLLDNVSCLIEPGQRIGLLGRNGAGKTSLLRMLAGEESPDAGEIVIAPGAKIAVLPQDVPSDVHGVVHDVILSGWTPGEHDEDKPWIAEHRIERLIDEMSLDGAARFETLSSGMKRRVLLARAIVSEPDLLLLDEPTNHLDVESIVRLEEFLKRRKAAYLFVTHDRMFLRNLADRILEIDRGRLFDWSCDYETFLKRKEEWLLAEEKQNELFDRKLAEAEVWIRTPIQARRTRNEGRVRAARGDASHTRRATQFAQARRDDHPGRTSQRYVGRRGRSSFRRLRRTHDRP